MAIRSNRAAGLVFDLVHGHWQFRVCVDGNANGLRRAEIGSTDVCIAGPTDVRQQFPEVAIAVDPTLRGPEGESGSPDPVRFGASDIASFSPIGTGSSAKHTREIGSRREPGDHRLRSIVTAGERTTRDTLDGCGLTRLSPGN
jgi:hypothetical protein